MMKYPLLLALLPLVLFLCPVARCLAQSSRIILPGPSYVTQLGSQGRDFKAGAITGEVLGREFGSAIGHFVEYAFSLEEAWSSPVLTVSYARAFAGGGYFQVTVDGVEVGLLPYGQTGGWGEEPGHFARSRILLPELPAGRHVIRLMVTDQVPERSQLPGLAVPPSPLLDLVGNRADKNSVGGGRNVALYTGTQSKVFYATYELGEICTAFNGYTVNWWPDHALLSPNPTPSPQPNVNIEAVEIHNATEQEVLPGVVQELRQVCVTEDDVLVAMIHLYNPAEVPLDWKLNVRGDLRNAHDWRETPGGSKSSTYLEGIVVLQDPRAFGGILAEGLSVAIGSSEELKEVKTSPAGTYRFVLEASLKPGEYRTIKVACAVHPQRETAVANLSRVLAEEDPIGANRQVWERFYQEEIPRFSSSDPGLDELYAFRWFLLRFSTAGGDLGYLQYPVVLEGRQAYQTYCCYSAPFMALDLNWARDAEVGYGHLANMCHAIYEDGRFPWYTTPGTNLVPLHHASRTGLSLLPYAVWRHYQIHHDLDLVRRVYPALAMNLRWWIRARDTDGNGLFAVEHQLETGMDDLYRWPDPELPYEAIDATSYAYINLQAVAALAAALGEDEDATYFAQYAQKAAAALNSLLWDDKAGCYRDLEPRRQEWARTITITTFYPFFAGAGTAEQLRVFREHLLNPERFWLPHPVPALSKEDSDFDPNSFWQGPAWPAATSHVIEAFATAAKELDRTLLPQAATLFHRAVRNHLTPRADFYERYNPLTGAPLSTFRDYMHSWWVDLYVRHVVGLMITEEGKITIDPLPLGLEYFSMENIPYRGQELKITWQAPGIPGEYLPGLAVYVDRNLYLHAPDFTPGDDPVVLTL